MCSSTRRLVSSFLLIFVAAMFEARAQDGAERVVSSDVGPEPLTKRVAPDSLSPVPQFSGVEIDDARESRGPSEAILAAGMGNLAA